MGIVRFEHGLSAALVSTRHMSQRSRRIACQNTRRNRKVVSVRMISEKLKAWRRHREAMRELSQLSDHELSDIGIGRGDIEYVVRRPVTSKPSA